MSNLIDKDLLFKKLRKCPMEFGYIQKSYVNDVINSLPITKYTQKPHGHWIECGSWSEGFGMSETYGNYYECSECNKQIKGGYKKCNAKFCSNCGADMREVNIDEDSD